MAAAESKLKVSARFTDINGDSKTNIKIGIHRTRMESAHMKTRITEHN